MIHGIHHVGIHCKDIDRMIRFYNEAFGFEVVGEKFHLHDSPELDCVIATPDADVVGAMLKAGNAYLELFQFNAPDPDSEAPKQPYDKGYTHFCIDTDDIHAVMPRLKAAGMDFKGRDAVDCGTVKTLYGWDPEGNIIEIQQSMAGCGTELSDLQE